MYYNENSWDLSLPSLASQRKHENFWNTIHKEGTQDVLYISIISERIYKWIQEGQRLWPNASWICIGEGESQPLGLWVEIYLNHVVRSGLLTMKSK